jgi:menaquinone-dependent protoporphyrinogen oxidase
MTRVLVATASKHGATVELGRRIAAAIAACGVAVDSSPLEQVDHPERYDAFVVGSAVYMGRWLPAARTFVERHRELVAERPTWLFSSGPVDAAGSADDHVEPDALAASIHARDHHVFGGRLDRASLGAGERAIVRLLRLPDADRREWHAAVAWGTAIGRTLAEEDGLDEAAAVAHRPSHLDFIG